MKTIDAVNMFNALSRFKTSMAPMPAEFCLICAINWNALQPVAAAFEESRRKLVENLAVKKEGKVEEQIGPDGKPTGQAVIHDMAKFNESFGKLSNAPVKVNLSMIDKSSLPAEIEPVLMFAILPMVEVK